MLCTDPTNYFASFHLTSMAYVFDLFVFYEYFFYFLCACLVYSFFACFDFLVLLLILFVRTAKSVILVQTCLRSSIQTGNIIIGALACNKVTKERGSMGRSETETAKKENDFTKKCEKRCREREREQERGREKDRHRDTEK